MSRSNAAQAELSSPYETQELRAPNREFPIMLRVVEADEPASLPDRIPDQPMPPAVIDEPSISAPLSKRPVTQTPAQLRPVEPLVSSQADDEQKPDKLTPEQTTMLYKYLPMAESIARNTYAKSSNPSAEFEEMMSDAYMGLTKGVKRFDAARLSEEATTGCDFIFRCIQGEVSRGMRDRFGRQYEVKDEETGEIILKGGTARLKPSVTLGTAISIDKPIDDGDPDGDTIGSLTPMDEAEAVIDHAMLQSDVNRILATCKPRDREIFIRGVYLQERQREIAEALGISQMHVSRLLKRITEHVQIRLGELG